MTSPLTSPKTPAWRQTAKPGVFLAAAQPPAAAAAPVKSAILEPNLTADLARILRPQAAYRWLLPQLAAISPQYIEATLRGALAGSHVQQWELFDLMEDTWSRLNKNLNEIKHAAVNLNWTLDPWAEQDTPPTPSALEKQALVNSALFRMRPDPAADENAFDRTVYDILDSWGKGVTVLETDWEIRPAAKLGNILAPRCTFWVHPVCYAWDATGRVGLRSDIQGLRAPATGAGRARAYQPNTWTPSTYQPLPSQVNEFPPDKFLIAIAKAKSGSALGAARLRPLAWWWCAANFSADWLLNLAQLFGLPFRWANYDPSAPQATIDAICSMLQNMGSAGYAAFPAGTQLELKEASKTGEASPQADMLQRADTNCDILILGQTLTTSQGSHGSQALGKVHKSVRDEIITTAADFAADVFNLQLIPSIIRQNYGNDEELPVLSAAEDEAQDQKANADRDAVLLGAGIPMPKKWFFQRHDIPIPAAGEEVVELKSAPLPAAGTAPKPGEGGPDAPKPKSEISNIKSEIAAKAAPGPDADLAAAALHPVVKALASDLQPFIDQLNAIMAIDDPAILEKRLLSFVASLDKLKADVSQDPELATQLYKLMSSALVNGLAAKTKH
jgi:phage gp29-like protein